MTQFFDGKSVAEEKESKLAKKVKKLKKKGIAPKLVSILVGDDVESKLYLRLKKEAGERIGVNIEIESLSASSSTRDVVEKIRELNKDKSVNGIMFQLPLPKNFSKKDRDKIVNAIAKSKDVDGLRNDSLFVTPVIRAVLTALETSKKVKKVRPLKDVPFKVGRVVVVGAKGFEGRKIVRKLKEMRYEVEGVDVDEKDLGSITKSADVIISVTGSAGLIKAGMIKKGSILIDVGSPKGDIEREAYNKASFVSPVPGGIGPATISYLLENLIEVAVTK